MHYFTFDLCRDSLDILVNEIYPFYL